MATESLIELSWRTSAPAGDRRRTRALAREALWSGTTVVLVVAAALLVSSAALHLHLWAVGYRAVPTIGPLFLAQGIATSVIALLVLLTRWLASVVVAIATMVSTVGGFILADTVGLFGFRDGFAAPDAWAAFVTEVSSIALLVIGAALIVRGSQHDRTMTQRGIAVDEMLHDAPTFRAGSDGREGATAPSPRLPPR